MTILPALNIPGVYNAPYVVNPAYAIVPENRSKRPRGESHRNGTCGYMGSLCSECEQLETEWHLRVAAVIAREYPPQPREKLTDYTRRAGIRMIDTWPAAAYECFRLAGIANGGF